MSEEIEIKIKKTTWYFIGIIFLVLIGGFLVLKNDSSSASGNSISGNSAGEIQEVTIGFKNYNYYPNTIKVKANQPVRIYLDSSVYGCYRAFTIRDFGISKYLRTAGDYVEFTPTKKGSYRFSCSMGMGVGTLIVE